MLRDEKARKVNLGEVMISRQRLPIDDDGDEPYFQGSLQGVSFSSPEEVQSRWLTS